MQRRDEMGTIAWEPCVAPLVLKKNVRDGRNVRLQQRLRSVGSRQGNISVYW